MDESFNDQNPGSTVQKVVADENRRQESPPQADDRKQFQFRRPRLRADCDSGQYQADYQG